MSLCKLFDLKLDKENDMCDNPLASKQASKQADSMG